MRRIIRISEEAYQALSNHSKKEGKTRKEIASSIIIGYLGGKEEKTGYFENNKEKDQPATAVEVAYSRAIERRKNRELKESFNNQQ